MTPMGMRLQDAWALVRSGRPLSKFNIATMAGVSTRTVSNMRAALRNFKEDGNEPPFAWDAARFYK